MKKTERLCQRTMLTPNKIAVTGHSSGELKTFLGPPNVVYPREATTIYTYFLEGGCHCYDKNWKEKGSTECLQILFLSIMIKSR